MDSGVDSCSQGLLLRLALITVASLVPYDGSIDVDTMYVVCSQYRVIFQ